MMYGCEKTAAVLYGTASFSSGGLIMKKTIIALVAALFVAGIASAQAVSPTPVQTQAQITKVSGKLELIQGVIGLKSAGKTYLVPSLQRVAGFIKGVEEGATVTVEGYQSTLPYTSDVILIHATKLTVGGKDYDLGQIGPNAWAGRGMNGCTAGNGMMQGRRGGGMMGGRSW
jgi:hypothetical protein